jgi:hypothetical protein
MRVLVFSLSLSIGAAIGVLGAPSGVLAQRDGGPVSPPMARAAYSRFAGFYRLVAAESRGYLAYDPAGYVSMTMQGPDEPSPEAMRGYAAYFGTFAVNAGADTITHQLFGALQPRFSLTDQAQRVTMSGNRLTLFPPAAGSRTQSSLTWERVPDLPTLTATQRQLVGFWRLVSTERRFTKDGGLARAYPGWTGFIVYAPSGHMMVHMMEPYRRRYAGDVPTPEEARATTQSYTSYFGTYTITGAGSLVHHFEGSINRSSIGTDTQRFFEVSGNTLILKPPVITTPEGDVIMTNVWERLTD